MQFNTDLFYVGGTKQPVFGKQQAIHAKAEWQLWFSEVCEATRMPLVTDYSFPVKPTKRQLRKLRRVFRKEAKHDLSVCGDACNCMKCNPSKSSCIALRADELGLPHIDPSMTKNVKPVPFSELPDGALFYIAQTYVYGNHTVFRKALEDGGEHNAVHVVNTNVTTTLPNDCMVIPA